MRIYLLFFLILSVLFSSVQVDGREAGKHAAKAVKYADKAREEGMEAAKLKAEDIWEGVKDGVRTINF